MTAHRARGGRLFGRQAFVDLPKTGIGTLTLGRQLDPTSDLVAQYTGPGFWSPSTHIGDNDNLNQTFRLNNTAQFGSDTIAGFTVDGVYAFSNQSNIGGGTGFSNNRALVGCRRGKLCERPTLDQRWLYGLS